jgi:soluble lytic murein transglycosylase
VNFRYEQLFILVVAVAAACGTDPPRAPDSQREKILDQGFLLAATDPARAADLFAEAGPGPSLEHSRLIAWADCLDRNAAASDAWRRYLDDQPPEYLANRARLALIRTLIDEGFLEMAAAESNLLPIGDRSEADAMLITVDDPQTRLEAAGRLVIQSPSILAAADRDLDRRLASLLEPEDQLHRASAWRRDGRPSTAAAELRAKRWSGEAEKHRRRELARAELAAGSPLRALKALPSAREAEDEILRAQSFRNRGWHLFPDRRARRQFADCVSAAGSAVQLAVRDDLRRAALVLRLECATESDDLVVALEAWRKLEALNWTGSRREWLGRRLGISLARRNGSSEEVLGIARNLPNQERCLRYWMAVESGAGGRELNALAEAGFADLYAQWSEEALARPPQNSTELQAGIEADLPPESVARLLAAGSQNAALDQWRRIRRSRPPTPTEALAAAETAAGHGRPTDAIRWLRAGFPELGSIDMSLAPENVIRAYLPVRFKKALLVAARESGLDPWLIAGVARQESGFAAHAVSPRGAIGVLQLLPSTARSHSRALGLGSHPDLRDPESNLRIGARELSSLLHRFGALEPALAAYNAGVTRVRGWWKRWPDRHRFTEEIPVPETYNYVRRVVYLSEAYRLVYEEEWRRER